MPQDEAALLDELRPFLNMKGQSSTNEEQWRSLFKSLVDYKSEYHTLVISKKDVEHKQLYHWSFRQRRLEYEGRLLPKRREDLLSIGFRFSKPKSTPSHDERFTKKEIEEWETIFQDLLHFKEEFGHCRVPFDFEENRLLGRWVHRQRVAFVSGRIDNHRKERLDEIGFQWKIRSNENQNKLDGERRLCVRCNPPSDDIA